MAFHPCKRLCGCGCIAEPLTYFIEFPKLCESVNFTDSGLLKNPALVHHEISILLHKYIHLHTAPLQATPFLCYYETQKKHRKEL